MEILPGLNCGACGFSGCRAYAEATVRECSLFNGCLPGGKEINEKIDKILGIVGCISDDTRSLVCFCGATESEKKVSTEYFGPMTCRAADLTNGELDCSYGCFGFGDCATVCPVSAITIVDKKVIIDNEKCVRCGKCVAECPRSLLNFIDSKTNPEYFVGCSNKEKALAVKRVCSKGCIGCTLCTKVENSPYFMKDNLSHVDYKNAADLKSLEEGKNKCPTKCIYSLETTKVATNV